MYLQLIRKFNGRLQKNFYNLYSNLRRKKKLTSTEAPITRKCSKRGIESGDRRDELDKSLDS